MATVPCETDPKASYKIVGHQFESRLNHTLPFSSYPATLLVQCGTAAICIDFHNAATTSILVQCDNKATIDIHLGGIHYPASVLVRCNFAKANLSGGQQLQSEFLQQAIEEMGVGKPSALCTGSDLWKNTH